MDGGVVMLVHKRWRSAQIGGLLLFTYLSSTPALAEKAESNFGSLKLAPGFPRSDGIAKGYTAGAYPLSAIANQDRNGKRCLGFGDTIPDHRLVLEKDFSRLQVKVLTGGKDTTLLIKGPDGKIWCGDDTGSSKDASVVGVNWPSGVYQVWVGVFNSGVRLNYNLAVEQ